MTGRMYIGSSADVETRHMNHLYALRAGKHPIEDMQKDFDEYGENFTFTVLDEIKTLDESEKEYQWMREFKSYVRGVGYNYKDHVFSSKPVIFKKESEKEKLIREINEWAEKTDELNVLRLVLSIIKKFYEAKREGAKF